MFDRLPFKGFFLKKIIGVGASAVLGPVGFVVPELIDGIAKGVSVATGKPFTKVADQQPTLKGRRTWIGAAIWSLGTVAASLGIWTLPPMWDDIWSMVIIGTISAKAIK